MADSSFSVVTDCRTHTFVLRGELDETSSQGLRETLAATRSSTITLDLTALSSIDNAGVACLAAVAQNHRRVILRGARQEHQALLDMASLRSEFEIEESRSPRPRPLTSHLSAGMTR